MSENYVEDLQIVNSATFVLACKKAEIVFWVRRASGFPIVQETVLRLVTTVDSLPVDAVREFFGFSAREFFTVLDPLVKSGYLVIQQGILGVTAAGKKLFNDSSSGKPAISTSTQEKRLLHVDRVCDLPVGRDGRMTNYIRSGLLPLFLQPPEKVYSDQGDSHERLKESFSANFGLFVEDKELELHKISLCRTLDEFLMPVDVVVTIENGRRASTAVGMIDDSPGRNIRNNLREILLGHLRESHKSGDAGACARYFEERVGKIVFGNLVDGENVAWLKLFEKGFSTSPDGSGIQLVVGASFLGYGGRMISEWAESLAKRVGSGDLEPIDIFWIKPNIENWGGSSLFVDYLGELHRSIGQLASDQVRTCLVSRQQGSAMKKFDRLFNEVCYLHCPDIPDPVEIVIVPHCGVLFLSHSSAPLNSPTCCPFGVATLDTSVVNSLGAIHTFIESTRPESKI
jgi:hypothetical protein